MSFAILRTSKIGSLGKVGAVGQHIHRTRKTPNADPTRSHLNQFSPGTESTLDRVKSRLPAKVRKNAVLAVEVLMTASPQYFFEKSAEQIDEWKQASLAWANQYFGGTENIVDWAFHLDETTPHIHAIVVPIDPKGKLNCRHFLNGKEKMSELQDSYAEAMKRFELDRGIKKSLAHHQDIKTYYKLAKTRLTSLDKHMLKVETIVGQIQPPTTKDLFNLGKWFEERIRKPLMKITHFIKHLYISKKKLEHSLQDQHHTNKRLRNRIEDLENRLAGVFSRLGLTENDLTNDRLTRPIRLFSKKIHHNQKLEEQDRARLQAQQEADEINKRLVLTHAQPSTDVAPDWIDHPVPMPTPRPKFRL